MQITFRRLDDKTHTLVVRRVDDSVERVVSETRSMLLHDFTHLAVESAAGLTRGFWGIVASGVAMSEIASDTAPIDAATRRALMSVEKIVAVLQKTLADASAEQLWAMLDKMVTSQDEPLPDWVTRPMLHDAKQLRRALVGQWKATAFVESMTLTWPLPTASELLL